MPSKSVNQVEGVNTPSLKFNPKEFCDVYDHSTFAGSLNIDTASGGCHELYINDHINGPVCTGTASFCAAIAVAEAKAGLIMI